MDALATIADLEARHGDIPADDYEKAQSALTDASATVRSFTGQTLSVATSTHTLKIRNGKMTVPQRPIIEVTSVVDTFGNALTFTVTGDRINVASQVFDSWSMEPYRSQLTEAIVEYEHGFDPMDDTIVSVVCQIALRALAADPETSIVSTEGLGSYSVGYGSVGASGPAGLFAGEKELLRRFRRELGSMRIYGS